MRKKEPQKGATWGEEERSNSLGIANVTHLEEDGSKGGEDKMWGKQNKTKKALSMCQAVRAGEGLWASPC